jgi:hypothetical protein
MLKSIFLALTFFCVVSLRAQEPTPTHKELDPLWMKVSIHAQNAAHRISMQGVDVAAPDPKDYQKEIKAIDRLLDQLVEKGVLKKHHFKLKPKLDLQDSLVQAVSEFMEKASARYGYYVVLEMMDCGTRQRTLPFDEKAPVVLNVRMPEKLLLEFEALLKKHEFHISQNQK